VNPLLGFTPDAPSVTPGVMLDCTQFIPYDTGMRSAPGLRTISDALAAACRGGNTLTKLSGSRRVFAGTAAKLYELSGATWSDVSRAGSYTLGATTVWSFAQFGDTSIAANIDNVIQTSTAGAFADQATSPQATIVESVLSSGGGFVFAFNTIDATYGTSTDRWWCSALNDVTSWTPSVASQATTGRLIGGNGPITAAKQLGADRIVAYKSGSIYTGVYVGPPTVWSWQEIPIYGCAGVNAIADLGTVHFVVGQEQIYLFDGARPTPVGDGAIRQWWLDNSSGVYRYKTNVRFDRLANLVWIFYVGAASSTGTLDSVIVYHLKTGQWGKADRTVEATMIYNTPGESFDASAGTSFDADVGTFDQTSPGSNVMSVFTSSHILSALDATPGSSNFTLYDIGDDNMVGRLTGAKLQYMTPPSSASMNAFSSMATGMSVTAGDLQSAYDVPANGSNSFPLRQTAKWHRLKFNFTGNVRVTGYDVPLTPAGRR
jgi:hypothetical protein